jgi:hypothetical protein
MDRFMDGCASLERHRQRAGLGDSHGLRGAWPDTKSRVAGASGSRRHDSWIDERMISQALALAHLGISPLDNFFKWRRTSLHRGCLGLAEIRTWGFRVGGGTCTLTTRLALPTA